MGQRRTAAACLCSLLVLVVLVGAGAARAADPTLPITATPTANSDPCTKTDGPDTRGNSGKPDKPDKRKGPKKCQQAPEAPASLLYPLAGGLAVAGFILFERRRRSPLRPAR
jgi:hypothetical protein